MQRKSEIFVDLKTLFSNNKKFFGLLLVSLILIVLFSGVVSAQKVGVWETLKGFLKPILGDKELVNDPILLKAIFAVLLFSLLFGGSQLVLSSYAKNTRIALATVLSIISVALVPSSLFMSVAKLYSGVFIAILLFIPVSFGIYLMFGPLKEKTKVNYAIKFGIAAIFWGVTTRFSGKTLGLGQVGDVFGIFTVIESIMVFLASVFLIMSIWYFVRIFTAETVASRSTGEGLEGAAKSISGFRKQGRRAKRYLKRGYRGEKKIVKDLESIKKSLMKPPIDRKKVSKDVEDAIDRANQMLAIDEYISEIEKNVEELAKAEKKSDIKQKIEIYNNELKKGVSEMVPFLKSLKSYLDSTNSLGGPTNPKTVGMIDQAIKVGEAIEKAILALEALNKDI